MRRCVGEIAFPLLELLMLGSGLSLVGIHSLIFHQAAPAAVLSDMMRVPMFSLGRRLVRGVRRVRREGGRRQISIRVATLVNRRGGECASTLLGWRLGGLAVGSVWITQRQGHHGLYLSMPTGGPSPELHLRSATLDLTEGLLGGGAPLLSC